MITPFSIQNGDAIIHGDIHHAHSRSCPIALLIHGFQGSKNWGFFPIIAEEFARKGMISIMWNMSLNGYSAHAEFMDQPEQFARNTISQELSDTQMIIDSLLHDDHILNPKLREQWNGEIYVLGHSRGGGIGILICEKNPSIKKLVLWNAISRFGRFTERQKKLWSETGIFSIGTTVDGRKIDMNYSYIQDLEQHQEEYAPLRAIEHLSTDICIIHAEQDMTVPIREAYALKEHARNVTMHCIPRTGHIFGSTHPFTEMTSTLRDAIDITTAFFST
ncbi:MAG: alpha/beta hydrolase family protein [Candidatus Kapaibacteriota bacterium]